MLLICPYAQRLATKALSVPILTDIHMVKPTFIVPFVNLPILDTFLSFGHQGLSGHLIDIHMAKPTFMVRFVNLSILYTFVLFGHQGLFSPHPDRYSHGWNAAPQKFRH